MKSYSLHVRVDGLDLLLSTLHLRYAYVLREVDHLALKVAQVYDIGIHDTNRADTSRSEVERDGSPQSASTNHEHARVHYLFLSLHADIL